MSADKYTCCEDGKSDCPCFTSEKSRPPPAPLAMAPMKVRDSRSAAARRLLCRHVHSADKIAMLLTTILHACVC